MRKEYGQNFLINEKIASKIIRLSNIKNNNIIEIGPGNLALTKLIKEQKPKKFVAVEIDKSLQKNYSKIDLNNIIFNNALTFNEKKYFNNENFSIISNLPFNISSQLLTKWIYTQNKYHCIDQMTLMFQKELADRIISDFNSKKYGRITILSKAFFNIEYVLTVLKKNFKPEPKVDASVLIFKKIKNHKIESKNLKKLEQITLFFFNERRKINKKKFEKFLSKNNLIKFEKYFSLRPENLKEDVYYELTKLV